MKNTKIPADSCIINRALKYFRLGDDNFIRNVKHFLNFMQTFELQINSLRSNRKKLEKEFNDVCDQSLVFFSKFENALAPKDRKEIRQSFQKIILRYLEKSTIAHRFYNKPNGYPGDYIMFEMIYNNQVLSDDFGYFLDNYIIKHNLAKAVRNRKNMIKEILKKFTIKSKSKPIHILNIGAGSAREIVELFKNFKTNKEIVFTLIDQDRDALQFCSGALSFLPKNIKINYENRKIFNMISFKDNDPLIRKRYDVIYSLGVADYFLDNTFEKFVFFFSRLLKPNGKLVIASCNSEKSQNFAPLRWFCEWIFYLRDANQVKKIIKEYMESASVQIRWEKTKQIFFLLVSKYY